MWWRVEVLPFLLLLLARFKPLLPVILIKKARLLNVANASWNVGEVAFVVTGRFVRCYLYNIPLEETYSKLYMNN